MSYEIPILTVTSSSVSTSLADKALSFVVLSAQLRLAVLSMALPLSRSWTLNVLLHIEGRPRTDKMPWYCVWPRPVCNAPKPANEFMSNIGGPLVPDLWVSEGRRTFIPWQYEHRTLRTGQIPCVRMVSDILHKSRGPIVQYWQCFKKVAKVWRLTG